jgi:hypothetical protein
MDRTTTYPDASPRHCADAAGLAPCASPCDGACARECVADCPAGGCDCYEPPTADVPGYGPVRLPTGRVLAVGRGHGTKPARPWYRRADGSLDLDAILAREG